MLTLEHSLRLRAQKCVRTLPRHATVRSTSTSSSTISVTRRRRLRTSRSLSRIPGASTLPRIATSKLTARIPELDPSQLLMAKWSSWPRSVAKPWISTQQPSVRTSVPMRRSLANCAPSPCRTLPRCRTFTSGSNTSSCPQPRRLLRRAQVASWGKSE